MHESISEPPDDPIDDFEAAVEAFEGAWQSGNTPDIQRFVECAGLDAMYSISLLHELVRLDLEYRWKCDLASARNSAPPHRPLLEDYVASYPSLGPLQNLPLDLIAEEYRVRRRWGGRPGKENYFTRFSSRASELTAALLAVDDEIELETDPAAESVASTCPPPDYMNAPVDIPLFDYRDFVLEAHLGSGGIGKVYRAWWKSKKEYVAVKMLRKSWWHQPGADELFFREAAILVQLRHSNIVGIHGIGCTPHGGRFLVMELIGGGDLGSLVAKDLPLADVLRWAAQAADALAFAHQRGIVHRDIKPSNLLLDNAGNVRVADFGLAIAPSLGTEPGGDGLVGTVAYMAPEQLLTDSNPVGAAADIFSLGAVLFTLLVGKPPFEGNSLTEVIKDRLERVHGHSLRSIRPDVPSHVEAIVNRCLAIDLQKRFASAKDLGVAIGHARRLTRMPTRPATSTAR